MIQEKSAHGVDNGHTLKSFVDILNVRSVVILWLIAVMEKQHARGQMKKEDDKKSRLNISKFLKRNPSLKKKIEKEQTLKIKKIKENFSP